MSEHVDMDRREQTLFLLDCDRRRDPWKRAASLFGERFRLGALPNGSGGREQPGELENTSVPGGLQLGPLRVGMGILGDVDGITDGVEHPLGISMLWRSSSGQQLPENTKRTALAKTSLRFSVDKYYETHGGKWEMFSLSSGFGLGSASGRKHSQSQTACVAKTFPSVKQVPACSGSARFFCSTC